MANGKHILVDPFLAGELDGLVCYPMELEDLESCEYLILTHTHSDHAEDVGRIQKKFPKLNLFAGDLSADALCEEQDIDCARLYRVRSGECYEFDDFKLEVFAGRHTESSRGYFRSGKDYYRSDGSFWKQRWFGNLEFLNYRLTLCDGTVIFIWGGMTSSDQKHRFQGMNANISLMHVSPKQDFGEFAELVHAIHTQIVIPHHYDFTEVLLKARPEFMNAMNEENRKYIENGTFRMDRYMEDLGNAVQEKSPETDLILLQHHKWYSFGFQMSE